MAAPAPPTGSQENVTSQTAGMDSTNGPRTWEKAWTVGEMRSEAGNWSLAADAGLLQHLQTFSQRIISRTHEIGMEVDTLVHESKLTGVRVNNVINDFIMLANSQFVENRVYDEDVSQATETVEQKNKAEPQEKTREEREAELIPRVTNALELGIQVVDTAFERLDTRVVDSDSEDEDMGYKPDLMLEPKDPYANRALPHLIGTPQFMEDDSVGLLEDESEEEEEESDNGSLSVSEEEEEEVSDETDTDTQETTSSGEFSDDVSKQKRLNQRQKEKRRTKTRSSASSLSGSQSGDSSEEEDMFAKPSHSKAGHADEESLSEEEGQDEEEEKEEAGPRQAAPKGRDFASELAARIGAAIPKKEASDSEGGGDDDWASSVSEPKRKHSNSQSSEKHQSTSKAKTSSKGKGKGKGDSTLESSSSSTRKKAKDQDQGLFAQNGDGGDDEDDDLFSKPGGLFSSSKGLFDDDNNDGDDNKGGLFESDRVESSKKKAGRKDTQEDLFGAEEEEEVVEEKADTRKRTASGKRLPQGAVSIFGSAGEDFLASPKVKAEPAKVKVESSKPQGKAGGGGGLFDDEEDEDEGDLFASVSSKGGKAAQPQATSPKTEKARSKSIKKADKPSKSSLLFDDDEDEDENDLFSSMSPAQTQVSAKKGGVQLEEEDEKDGRRGMGEEEEKPKKKTETGKKLPAGAVSLFGNGPNPMVSALQKRHQEDSQEEDGWSDSDQGSSRSGSVVKEEPKAGSGDLLVDSMGQGQDGGSLFGVKDRSGSQGKQPTAPAATDTKKSSLFDSLPEDNSSNIFTSSTSSDTSKGPSAFSRPPASGNSAIGTNQKEQAKSTVPASKSPAKKKATVSLFDDDQGDEEEDLFFTKPSTATQSVPSSSSSSSSSSAAASTKQRAGSHSQSLFQDDDLLFGSDQGNEPQVDLFTQPAASTAQQPPAPTSSLFSEDDNDNLFSVAKPKPTRASNATAATTATTAPATSTTAAEKDPEAMEKGKTRKPIGGVSMFGGLDPLALAKKGKRVQEEKKEEEEEKKEEKKEEDKKVDKVEEKKGGNPKTASGLFGENDGGDDDDLFSASSLPKQSTKKSPVQPPTHEDIADPKPEVKVTDTQVKDTESSGSFDGDNKQQQQQQQQQDDKEDLVKNEESGAQAGKKSRRPIGGVSMFGGVDMFAGLKKKAKEPEEEPKEKEEEPKEEEEEPREEEKEEKETSPVKEKKLALAINPAALLPGSAHPSLAPKALTRSTSVDFQLPPEVDNTLTSAAKDRAKVITRRRPQSRKARRQAVTQSQANLEDLDSPTSPFFPDMPAFGDTQANGKTDAEVDSGRETDLFSSGEEKKKKSEGESRLSPLSPSKMEDQHDDLFSPRPKAKDSANANQTAKPKPTPKTADSDPFSTQRAPAALDDGLFSSSKLSTGKAVKDNDDLFSSSSLSKDKKSSKKEAVLSPGINDDDDLFSSASFSTPKSSSAKKSESKPVEKAEKADVGDVDDLFSSTPALSASKVSSAKKQPTSKAKLLDDDDDLFSSPKIKTETAKPSKKPLVDEDDDDIFADSSLKNSGKTQETEEKTAPKKTRPKKAVTKESSLLSDTTDIFAGVPELDGAKDKKTKGAKKKKVTGGGGRSLFKDDVDDIFADTPAASTTKAKKDAKGNSSSSSSKATSASTTPTATLSDDIFQDPLS